MSDTAITTDLNSYSKADLILMIISLNKRLAEASVNFSMNKGIVASQAGTIKAQSKALRRSMANVRSMRQTLRQRRKHRGRNNL
jgi:hypothetical protein